MPRTRTSTLGAPSRFATGIYAGDGAATQAIVGVGFRPKAVFIFLRVNANLSTPAYAGDVDAGNTSFYWAAPIAMWYDVNHVISLDADGFTVGNGTGPPGNVLNVLGMEYTYVCFG